MGRARNPRNREEEEPGSSTPMPEPATASGHRNLTPCTPLIPSSKKRFIPSLLKEPSFSSGRRNPTPCTPATPSSSKNYVLLLDWWLISAKRSHDGKTLGVGGVVATPSRHNDEGCASGLLLSPFQKAERVFDSAPIIKRYDTSTLGTADGITVRIQGVINKARSHLNGFSLEVCSNFLIGFPYNWDDYADEYFEKESTTTSVPASASDNDGLSKGLADAAGCLVHLDEFSVNRILAVLTSTHDAPMDELLTRKVTEFLERFCSCTSMNPTTQMPSDMQNCHLSILKSCLPGETLSKNESDKINQKHKNSTEYATLVDRDAEGHAAGHTEEVGCHRNDLNADGIVGENSFDVTATSQQNLSLDSLLHLNSKIDNLPERCTDIQKVTPLENITEPEKGIYLVRSVPGGMDTVNHMLNCIEGETNGKSTRNLADLGIKSGPNDMLPKVLNLSHTKQGKEPGNNALRRSHRVERLRARAVGVSKDYLVTKVSDMKDANSLRVEMNAPLETSLNTHVGKSSKASNKKEKGCRTRSRIPSKNEIEASSSFLLSQDVLDLYHVEGEPGDVNNLKSPDVGFSGISKHSSSIEMNDAHPEILGKIEKCKFHAVKDPTAQIGSVVDMRSSITSEVGMCSLKEPLTEPVGNKGKDRLMKLKNIQKDQKCAECMNRKRCMHGSTSATRESVGVGMNHSEENLTASPWGATDETLSTENGPGHVNRGNISRSVVRKLHYNTRSAHRNSPSIFSESQCLDRKVKFSSNGGAKIVEEIPTTDATTSICRMLKVKNKGEGDQTTRSSLVVENNGARSVPVDHNFVNAVNYVKHKHKHKRARYLATVGVVKGTLQSSPRESDIDPMSTSETTHNQHVEYADKQTSVNAGHESEYLKCSVGNATQSDIPLELHPSKDNKLDVIGKKIRKKQKLRDVHQDEVVVQPMKDKALCNSGRTVWRPSYTYVNQSPLTRDMAKKLSIVSPESLNLRRSRSGRLLVPPIAKWCQKIIYTADGEISGITVSDEVSYPQIGSQSEPPRNKKKLK